MNYQRLNYMPYNNSRFLGQFHPFFLPLYFIIMMHVKLLSYLIVDIKDSDYVDLLKDMRLDGRCISIEELIGVVASLRPDQARRECRLPCTQWCISRYR